jgi:predicted ATPase/class 3 adenylate cyclase
VERAAELPSGTVTFLFTDIEGSTLLLRRLGAAAYTEVLEAHRHLIRGATGRHEGVEVRTEGDGMFFAFRSAVMAVSACREAQRALAHYEWPHDASLRVRMGLHTGEANVHADEDYVGLAVHQASRVVAVAHGGQVLVSAEVLAATGTDEPGTFADLGEFVLRSFEQPARLYQLCDPGLVSSFPPPRAPPAAVHNLGVPRTSFVGRDDELAELATLLSLPSLVTIVGPGGIGKTRLATEAGLRLAGRFPGGAWLVGLARLGDRRLLASAIASALGVSGHRQPPIEDALVDRLSRAATLVILDNCEHVVEDAAELVAELLRQCPELTVLATSREVLGLPEEHVLRLSSLPGPASLALFAQRAEQARRGLALAAGNAAAAREVCRRLEGIPLALELAAARLSALSPAQLASRLSDTMATLDVGRRGGEARQRTMRATIDWSYELLGSKDREVFCHLSVFRGGFDAEAATLVTGASLEQLDALVAQSLVEPEPDTEPPRYRMLEPIRQYAWAKLDQPGRDALHQRHATWAIGLAMQAAPQVLLDQARWTERLEAEGANIAAAIDWSLSTPGDESALRIVGLLGVYWFTAGRAEALGWIEQALDQAEQANPGLRGVALLAGSAIAQLRPLAAWSGATEEGHTPGFSRSALWASEAVDIFRQSGAARGLAWALFWQGRAVAHLDRHFARAPIAEALALFRGLEDPLGITWCLNWTAAFALDDERWAEGEALSWEVVQIGRATGVDHAVGDALTGLGRLAGRAGDRERAVELMRQAVAHYRDARDRWQLTGVLTALAFAEAAASNHDEAAAAVAEALNLAEEHGFDDRLGWLMSTVAVLLPDDLIDISAKLYATWPYAESDWPWPDAKWARKRQQLAAQCDESPRAANPTALHDAVTLARGVVARIRDTP